MLKSLPIGTYTFRDIIQGGSLYVDKTETIYELLRPSKGIFFLSRPRRFGKSLLISTLEEIFQGNRELFNGLWLYDSPYDWQIYPILQISFGPIRVETASELEHRIHLILNDLAESHKLTLPDENYQYRFQKLIQQRGERGSVVIVIDEYDKPILDIIEDSAEAEKIRDILRSFYGVIKAMDRYIRFVLLTGISRFSKVGVFSELNHLRDISLEPRFSSLLGITQSEVEANFKEYLSGAEESNQLTRQELLAQLRRWYNGYGFSRQGERVYNPFSLLLFFVSGEFRNYWFESGTPLFLIKLIKERNYNVAELDQLTIGELAFSNYEIETLEIVPLLYQTGYLTIKDFDPQRQLYTLGFPNYEVENAFLTHLLGAFSQVEPGLSQGHLWSMIEALQQNKLTQFFDTLSIFFAQLSYDLHIKQEKYYQSIFYLIFNLIGLQIAAEVTTNRGRIDAVIELSDRIYLFEFKINSSAQKALEQIVSNEYYQRYLSQPKPIHLVGVNFSTRKRAVSGWKEELIKPAKS